MQHDIVWNSREANFERLAPRIAGAVASGVDLVLLTETFSTGFAFAEPRFVAEPEGGESSRFLAAQAAEHGVWVGGSCPEIRPDNDTGDERPSNSFVLAGPDGTLHRYHKIHPFSHAREERFVRPGTEFVTVAIEGVRVSMFVCYDLRFADEFWQLALDTDVYLVPANWPSKRRDHWSALLRARAIENQAYVVGVNRVGVAPGEGTNLVYVGDSAIIDPQGATLAAASEGETVIMADIDTEFVASTRDHFRFLPDRRHA